MLKHEINVALLLSVTLLPGCLVSEGTAVGQKDGKTVYQSTCDGPVGGTPTLGGGVVPTDFACTAAAEKTCPAGYLTVARDAGLPQFEVRKTGTPTGYMVQRGYFQSVTLQYSCR